MEELLKEIKSCVDCIEYISKDGKLCYKTSGDLMWYLNKCNQYLLSVKRTENGYIAKGKGFEFEFCENDIIYAIDLV